jgi:hypothetical protein
MPADIGGAVQNSSFDRIKFGNPPQGFGDVHCAVTPQRSGHVVAGRFAN